MASAVRHRAAAGAARLLQRRKASSPASHHLLQSPSADANGSPSGSLFPFAQSLRNCSSSSRSTAVGLLLDGSGRAAGDSLARQDGRLHLGVCERGRVWDQQSCRQLSTNTSKSNESDGEIYTSEMIKFAASQRKDAALHMEVTRILDQGYNFLISLGPSSANAAAKVLLMLATFYVDGGKLQDAVEVLQKIPILEGVSVEVGVSASQALVGIFLRMHEDSLALAEAQSMCLLVTGASGLPPQRSQELLFRAAATLQFVEHATYSKTSGGLLDMSSLTSWLNDKEAHLDGVAAALVGVAECYHIRGHFSQAKDYYEKASALAESSLEKAPIGLSSGAMTAADVVVQAEAGMGQAAAHLGDFDDAEKCLTRALGRAEQINGEKHPRVGIILACIAEVYAQRGVTKGSGDITLPEGLYRRATDLLGAPPLDAPEKDVDWSDVIAITRARHAALLMRAKNRGSEAEKLQAWADAVWTGPCELIDVLAQDASTKPIEDSVSKTASVEDAYTGRYVVIDAGLGRVLFTPTNY